MAATHMIKLQAITKFPAERSSIQSAIRANNPLDSTALWRRKLKHAAIFSIWVLIVFWFFNSHFFGFSTVCVSTEGIRLNYRILSFRNTVLYTSDLALRNTFFIPK